LISLSGKPKKVSHHKEMCQTKLVPKNLYQFEKKTFSFAQKLIYG